MKKFEIGKSDEIEKFNEWFTKCSTQNIPYIIIKNKSKYSRVEWDHINLHKRFDTLFSENNKEHKRQMISIFEKYANTKSSYTLNNLLFYADNLFQENALGLAEELFDYIESFIKAH